MNNQDTTNHSVEQHIEQNSSEQLMQLQNRYRQLLADFENYRRNVERERLSWSRNAVKGCISDVVDLVDDFERAQKEIQTPGFDLLYRAFLKLLAAHGVTAVDASGEFNPALHEALAYVESPSVQPGHIVDVVKKGYYLNKELLRPAQVVVAKAPEA